MDLSPSTYLKQHPLRDSLTTRPPTDIHRQAYELAELVSEIPSSPKLHTQPRALVVGSFPLQPEIANDIDIEVQGVSWRDLQQFFNDKVGRAGITNVTLTTPGEDGIIDPSRDPREVGNAFVAVWLTLEGERKAQLSIPMRTNEQTNRYDLNSVDRDPDLPFAEASKRRNFAHRAVGYDPRQGSQGTLEDPHNGAKHLAAQKLSVLKLWSYVRDPLGFFEAVREMAEQHMKPTKKTEVVLTLMAEMPLPTGREAVRPERLNAARAKLLDASAPPSICLKHCFELGAGPRDFPEMHLLFQKLFERGHPELVERIYGGIDEAWESASKSASWTHHDRLVHVLARLAFEVEEAEAEVNLKTSCMDFVRPFLIGGRAEKESMLRDISNKFSILLESSRTDHVLSNASFSDVTSTFGEQNDAP